MTTTGDVLEAVDSAYRTLCVWGANEDFMAVFGSLMVARLEDPEAKLLDVIERRFGEDPHKILFRAGMRP